MTSVSELSFSHMASESVQRLSFHFIETMITYTDKYSRTCVCVLKPA